MSGLKWVRLDTSIWAHDKIVDLLEHKEGHRAFTLYIFGLAYAGMMQTDGRVPGRALPALQSTRKIADVLVDQGLWKHLDAGAYQILNYDERQQISQVTEAQVTARRKSACSRWMKEGRPCSCGQH